MTSTTSTRITFTSEQALDGGVLERRFTLGLPGTGDTVPGILWTPGSIETAPAATVPLVLLGQPGGLDRLYPRLAARACDTVAAGFAAATLELPGCGDRPRSTSMEQARADLQRVIAAGGPVDDGIVERLVVPLVDAAAPEAQAAIDALLALPGVGGPVGLSGGNISVGIRLARTDPRVTAAVLFAGSRVPHALVEEARQVAVPLLMLLQWDDEGNDRQEALDLFDALGSTEKTLHANLGGHTGVPAFESEAVNRFFARHLT